MNSNFKNIVLHHSIIYADVMMNVDSKTNGYSAHIVNVKGKVYVIAESLKYKICYSKSGDYNYLMNKCDGFFARWNKDDSEVEMSPVGPEIADIEITTICSGTGRSSCSGSNGSVIGKDKLCKFCYKSNTPTGKFMDFKTFKRVFDKLPKSLTQIAFGVDSHGESNPDMFKIMDYCLKKQVVPNLTIAEITDKTADELVKRVGATAVSRYHDKDICYDTVKKLTDRGLKQTNVHIMVSTETYDDVMETLRDRLTDSRLSKLNVIVLLSLKKKGRGIGYTKLSDEKFKSIVDFALENKIGIGFDSCSAPKFLNAVKDSKDFEHFKTLADACESQLTSCYINVEGKYFPCSFTEGTDDWTEGIDVVNCKDFLTDVWYNERVVEFRNKLLETSKHNCMNCRSCPKFEV